MNALPIRTSRTDGGRGEEWEENEESRSSLEHRYSGVWRLGFPTAKSSRICIDFMERFLRTQERA